MIRTEFLDFRRKLVEEVVSWLFKRTREMPSGVSSLEHLLVVVPTKQSARQLRLALAKKAGTKGMIPPRVALPAQLVRPRKETLTLAEATDGETAAAMMDFLETTKRATWPVLFPAAAENDDDTAAIGALALAEQFQELWDALGTNGLLMADVARQESVKEILRAAGGDELPRWEELADFETRFFAFLNQTCLRLHPAQVKKMGVQDPELPGPEIAEIVLPALVDPVPAFIKVLEKIKTECSSPAITVLLHADPEEAGTFDEYGRPVPEKRSGENSPVLPLETGDIITAGKSSDLVKKLAEMFPEKRNLEPPALGLVDESLFPEMEAAFLQKGVTNLHNPERHKLFASSLGRLALNLYTLLSEEAWRRSFAPFAQLLRENDVLAAVCGEKGISGTKVLKELSVYINKNLPRNFPTGIDAERYPALSAARDAVSGWLSAGGDCVETMRSVLRRIYEKRMIGNVPGDREFAAAAEALAGVLAEMRSELITKLSPQRQFAIFRKLLSNAVYQLEPEDTDVLKTEGWLELAWSDASNIAIAGMCEGKVPDAIVGHAFLPDSLRTALGLACNGRRLVRDAYLFGALLASHQPGAVKVFVPLHNANGDVQRPSRLLFMCEKEKLPARVKALFRDDAVPESTPPRKMPEKWVLDLTLKEGTWIPESFSASAVDAYTKCPFTYYLSNVLRMRHDEAGGEIAANDYGTLVHQIMNCFLRKDAYKRLRGSEEIRCGLGLCADEVLAAEFPKALRTGIQKIQLETIKNRVMSFSAHEAAHRAEGWTVLAGEAALTGVYNGLKITGIVDRIDVNADGNYCIIDYKTWDTCEKDTVDKKMIAGGKEYDYACIEMAWRKWPTLNGKRWLSTQMAFYDLLLKANRETYSGSVIEYKYAVLGVSEAKSGFVNRVAGIRFAEEMESAKKMIDAAISGIADGVFWPPAPGNQFKYDFANLFTGEPEEDYKNCALARRVDELKRKYEAEQNAKDCKEEQP